MAIQEKRMPTSHQSQLVQILRARGCLRSERVEKAFLAVDRKDFLTIWYTMDMSEGVPRWATVVFDPEHPSSEQLDIIYSLAPLVTDVSDFRPQGSLSAPSLVSEMLELLNVAPGMKVLEIGTCSGYNAALLAELVGPEGNVHTIEARQTAARSAKATLGKLGYSNIAVHAKDGYYGHPSTAPYDRLIATAGCSDLSPLWIEQLHQDRQMVIPMNYGYLDYLMLIERDSQRPDVAHGKIVGTASFMAIRGVLSWANPWTTLENPSMKTTDFRELSLPKELPPVDGDQNLIFDPVHSDFYYFLTQSSRELWFCNQGYGIADLVTQAKAVVSRESIRVYGPKTSENSAYRLLEKLLRIYDRWVSLGCPGAGDFHIEFIPKDRSHQPAYRPSPSSHITERLFHIETRAL